MFLVFPLIMQFYTQQSKIRDKYGVKSVYNSQTNIPNWKQIFKLVEGNQATFFDRLISTNKLLKEGKANINYCHCCIQNNIDSRQ